jgi:hypothetical protein
MDIKEYIYTSSEISMTYFSQQDVSFCNPKILRSITIPATCPWKDCSKVQIRSLEPGM